MDINTILLIALCVCALISIAFFAVFRGKGKIAIESKLAKLTAEGENPIPSTSVIKMTEVESGGSIHAHNANGGIVELGRTKAGKDIIARNDDSGAGPPKV